MSHKQKPDPLATQSYQASLQEAKKPSPLETELQTEAMDTLNWIKAGDYTKRPKNVFFNPLDPALRKRNRELMLNAKGQGVMGLGTPDPTLLALNRENLMAHQAEDDAAQYEQDVSQAGQAAAAQAGDLSKLDLSRKQGVLGTTAGVYNAAQNAAAQQKPWWSYFLQGAGSGAAIAGA